MNVPFMIFLTHFFLYGFIPLLSMSYSIFHAHFCSSLIYIHLSSNITTAFYSAGTCCFFLRKLYNGLLNFHFKACKTLKRKKYDLPAKCLSSSGILSRNPLPKTELRYSSTKFANSQSSECVTRFHALGREKNTLIPFLGQIKVIRYWKAQKQHVLLQHIQPCQHH